MIATGEAAKRLAVAAYGGQPTVDQQVLTANRLRGWLREGILSCAGKPRPGAGRAREISADTLHRAAVLVRLADVEVAGHRLRTIAEQIGCDPLWSQATAGTPTKLLLSMNGDDTTAVLRSRSEPVPADLLPDPVLIVDLTTLLSKV